MKVNNGWFHHYVESQRLQDKLIVQPRMGFSEVALMQSGLRSVRNLPIPRIGTITLDAMTRQRMWAEAEAAVKAGMSLNGYPIVTHGVEVTTSMLRGLHDSRFPIQVRHGSPLPNRVFEVACQAGIDSIEGGPISYCLPYGRVPLNKCVAAWDEAVRYWADSGRSRNAIFHLESFAGCMMGQLTPPDLLVALSIIEGRFFVERGIRSLSLSHSQGTNFSQDVGAILALRRLAREYLPPDVYWHVVLYTWMGVFPESEAGARRLIEDSAVIAMVAHAERVIVKTVVEAFQIPSIEDNLRALNWVVARAEQSRGLLPDALALDHAERTYRQARAIIDAVLNLASNLNDAIPKAFEAGILDIPFCFHPDNRNEARAFLDPTGIIGWDRTGRIPLDKEPGARCSLSMTSGQLLTSLSFNKRRYDEVKK